MQHHVHARKETPCNLFVMGRFAGRRRLDSARICKRNKFTSEQRRPPHSVGMVWAEHRGRAPGNGLRREPVRSCA